MSARAFWRLRWADLARAALVFASLLSFEAALAHQSGSAEIQVNVGEHVEVQLSPGRHDLLLAIGVLVNLEAPVIDSEFVRHAGAIERYVKKHLGIATRSGSCRANKMQITAAANPEYVNLRLSYSCGPDVRWLLMGYGLFFNLDPEHIAVGELLPPKGLKQDIYFDVTLQKLVFEW